jgi:hypothetical protein
MISRCRHGAKPLGMYELDRRTRDVRQSSRYEIRGNESNAAQHGVLET